MQEHTSKQQAAEPRKVLDRDTLEALEEGIRSEETGQTYTWEEAKKFARERRQAWTKVPESLSA
jgi:hypothetical protein